MGENNVRYLQSEQYKPGDRIGGEYEVVKVFGGEKKSGMGVVYLVNNREVPFPFVLKTYQQSINTELRHQFIAEAHAWINAGVHPNIVQAYWVREIADQIYIAAEYIEPDDENRNSLTDYLNNTQIPLEICLLWASQFCYGMDYAHKKGVLAHRDIKPANLMIDRMANLKVTDFGIAKVIDTKNKNIQYAPSLFGMKQKTQIVSNTKTGNIKGTLPYMAPEQFVDAKSIDHRADIYSFGIILYQMVSANSYPYHLNLRSSNIELEFLIAHTKQEPILLKSPLMEIISRCLEKKANKRYKNYEDLLGDLKTVADKHNIRLPKNRHTTKEDEELYSQAQSYIALGDSDRALRAIDEYVSKYPDFACGWTEKGRIHFERNEYPQGINATKRSLDLNPYNTHAWNNLGLLLNRTQAPLDEIKAAYGKALFFDPNNTAAMMNLIGPLTLNREFSQAAKLTVNALRKCPDKPSVLYNTQSLIREIMESPNLEGADILFRGWTSARPQDVDAWHNFGLVSLTKGDLDQAIICFNQVHQLTPLDNFAILQLAKLYFRKQNGRKCIETCNLLLERNHEPLIAISLKARAINSMGMYREALEFLQPYINNNPDNDTFLVTLSELYEYQGNNTAAIDALRKAKKILETGNYKFNKENFEYINEKIRMLTGR